MTSTYRPRILASLRSAALDRLDEELAALILAGVDGLHIDIMDGEWVGEQCFPLRNVADVRQKTSMCMDVHLMVADPQRWTADLLALGVDRIAFHVETLDAPVPLLDQIRAAGAQPGLVLLPSTPIEAVLAWLDRVDVVNPLGVDPRAGLGFQESTFDRIAALCRYRDESGLDFRVQADGGVWDGTRDALLAAGADELVGGYPIFSSDDYAQAVRELREGRGAAS